VKKCRKCQIEKLENCFHQRLNAEGKLLINARCKECVNNNLREKYQNEKEYHIKRANQWAQNNPEKSAIIKKRYYEKNKSKFQIASKKWIENNRDKACQNSMACNKKRYKTDPLFRLACCVRHGVYKIAKAIKENKQKSSLIYLGCSLEEFRIHIENQWSEGMSWDNHSIYGWHIDHIIPLDHFIKNEEDPWKANHYTNLQPLWAKDNLKKSNL
jgi:hypothetical protein